MHNCNTLQDKNTKKRFAVQRHQFLYGSRPKSDTGISPLLDFSHRMCKWPKNKDLWQEMHLFKLQVGEVRNWKSLWRVSQGCDNGWSKSAPGFGIPCPSESGWQLCTWNLICFGVFFDLKIPSLLEIGVGQSFSLSLSWTS